MAVTTATKTYAERISAHTNPTAIKLLTIMDRKQTNLCVSVDVTTTADVLDIVRSVGHSVCMVKTHCDIISDFTLEFADELKRLAEEMDFLVFEDRKFADIGNTVSLQYSSGLHRIASWSHLTNAHPLPGPGIISGLSKIGAPLGHALLLLAEMSSAGNLAKGTYTSQAYAMAIAARKENDFVVGFIGMSRTPELEASGQDWLILTPGVGLRSTATGDALGQQYRTPKEVVGECGCDVIIVGRGIYGDMTRTREVAETYRRQGWQAYLDRVGK
ncbi:hypothetical protein P7C73_g6040, partial [Tremellales sp. Uapishka_1]